MARRNRGAAGHHGRVTPPAEHSYMDPAEIEGRTAGPGSHPAPTSFKQIGLEEQGGDANNPSFTHLSGDFKFTSGPGR